MAELPLTSLGPSVVTNFFSGTAFTVSQTMLWIGFLVVVLVYLFISVSFVYHAERYCLEKRVIRRAEIVYFLISLLLLSGMAAIIFVYPT